MGNGRPPGDAPDHPVPPGGRGRSSDEGLRALGDKVEGGSGRTDIANERGLRALGSAVDQAHVGSGRGRRRRKRWSRRRKILTPVISLVVLALLLAGAAYGYARYRYDQIGKVTVAAEHQAAAGQPFNVLVIGSDTRVGAKGTTGIGTTTTVGGQRSDVVMIWHVVPSTRTITILSIPRDTMMQMEGTNVTQFGRFNRINASYNSGANLLVETIQDNLGIPINHVAQVDFSGFEGAVNALGGVYMDFEYPAKDAYSGLDITTTGCQLLDGTEALAVARSRHYEYFATGQWQYTPTGDLGRIKRQDAFLRALVDAAKSKYNPLTLNAFIGSLPQGIEIDKTFSLGDLIGLAEDFHSITPSSLVTYTLPTTTIGYVTPWGDVLFVDQPADQQLLVQIFGNELMTPTTPPPDTTLQPEAPPSISTSAGAAVTTPTAGTASTSATGTATTAPNQTPTYDPTPCSP
jgi:LCP family protein required for cell wall assembly